MLHQRLPGHTSCFGFYQVHQDIDSTTELSDNICLIFFFAYIICKFQAQQKKQHDSPRLNRHAAFLFIIFFRLFISCAQAYISLFAPSSQILPASRQARQICHFSEEYSPLCWAAASGQVSLFRCSSHLSSEYPSLFILCFLHARRSPHPAEAGLHLCRQI